MKVWRRLVDRRLVAMLLLGWVLTAGTAAAGEQIRVKVGPANVYERPRAGAAVLMTVSEGTVLEVIGRDGDWYWIIVPRDANGTRRGGYIAAYLVEPVSGKTIAEPARARQARPLPAAAPPADHAARPVLAGRYLFAIGGGGQSVSPAFADTSSFPLYDETAQYQVTYTTPRASALDASVGIRLAPRFVLAVAYWRSTPLPTADVTASVPHPFTYNAARFAAADGFVVSRLENDLHVQFTWQVPVARNMDLSIFGGPSVFFLGEDVVSGLSFRETYPYDAVTISGFQTERRSKAGFGANAGADLTVMVWRYFGVGATARYARAAVKLPGATAQSVSMQAGGLQASGGVRVRF